MVTNRQGSPSFEIGAPAPTIMLLRVMTSEQMRKGQRRNVKRAVHQLKHRGWTGPLRVKDAKSWLRATWSAIPDQEAQLHLGNPEQDGCRK